MGHVGCPSQGMKEIGRLPGAITGHQDRHEIRLPDYG